MRSVSFLNSDVISKLTSFRNQSMEAVSVKKIGYTHKHEDLLCTNQYF